MGTRSLARDHRQREVPRRDGGHDADELLDSAQATTHALTNIRIDGTGIGKLAASRLIDRIKHGDEERRTVDVGFTLMERDSA